MTGGPGKGHGTNKPPPTGRVLERSKGDTTCPTTSQNPPLWHPSWLNKACTTRKDHEAEWLAKDHPETNAITVNTRVVLLGSLTLLLSAQVPFPNKISCFVSTCVSSDNSFLSVRQEPSFGLWKGSPILQHYDNVWRYFWWSQLGRVVPLTCRWQLTGMLLNIQESTGQTPTAKMIWSKMQQC